MEEIYAGTGSTVSESWSSPTRRDINEYNKYYSTAQFIISGSRDLYYETLVQEEFKTPIVDIIKGDDVIKPHFYGDGTEGYTFDGNNIYWEELPELYLYFNCQKNGEAVVSITIETILTIDEGDGTKTISETIKFYFSKTCDNSLGYREGFSIRNEKEPFDVVNHGHVQSRWSVTSDVFLDKNPVVISEIDHTTVFHISISSLTYGNEFFSAPVIFVEDDDVLDLSVRGHAQNGDIATVYPLNIVLIYDCKTTGNTEITVSISIGFFGTIQFGFNKVCKVTGPEEHGMSGILNIGTSRNDFAGVVLNSITSLFWNPASPTVVIPVDEISTNFYVSTLSGQTQDFLKPIVSVNPSSAFGVTVSGNLRDGGVATGSPQHFTINYLCTRVTSATITVSLKLPGPFNTIEYAYTKQCKALRSHTGHYYTANQILFALLFTIAVVVAVGYIFYRKRVSSSNKVGANKARP